MMEQYRSCPWTARVGQQPMCHLLVVNTRARRVQRTWWRRHRNRLRLAGVLSPRLSVYSRWHFIRIYVAVAGVPSTITSSLLLRVQQYDTEQRTFFNPVLYYALLSLTPIRDLSGAIKYLFTHCNCRNTLRTILIQI